MLLSIVECGNHRYFNPDGVATSEVRDRGDFEIIGPVIGASVAIMRNRGAQLARGRWIFFKDQDCTADFKRIYSFVTEMDQKKKSWGAVGGFYSSDRQKLSAQVYHWIQRTWVRRGLSDSRKEKVRLAQHLLGGALLVNKEAFNLAGGFDEKIGWGGEELDLTLRLIKKGFLTGVSARIRVAHENNIGFWGLCKRAWFQSSHRGRYSLDDSDQLRSRSPRLYFTAPVRIAPWVGLFFLVAFVASRYGQLIKTFSIGRRSMKWTS